MQNRLKDLLIRSEEIGFSPEQMTTCTKCSKANPPNRFKCLYCGSALEISAEAAAKAQLNLRPLETWEYGFNVIVMPGGNPERFAETLSKMLGLERDAAEAMAAARGPFPAARVESGREAEMIRDKITEAGFAARIVSDETLAPDKPPRRLRAVEFDGERIRMTLFNSGEKTEIERKDLALIVAGSIFESKTEATEKRKKRAVETIGETQTSTDEMVLDIYSNADSTGWRIREHGFDFSCLGAAKGLIAAENLRRLAETLAAFAPGARIDRDFDAASEAFGLIWELEQTSDSTGFQRSMFGSGGRTRTHSVSNLLQFTKYSRMHRHLL